MASDDFLAALRALCEGGVEFVIVGELAATLHGAPDGLLDVEIVTAWDDVNRAKLPLVLDSIDALYRVQPDRRLKPDASLLRSADRHNLLTSCGPLDVLGRIGRGLTYQDLLPHTVEMDMGDGARVRVLDLETIIAVKQELGTEKDLAVLPVLRRALKEKQRGG